MEEAKRNTSAPLNTDPLTKADLIKLSRCLPEVMAKLSALDKDPIRKEELLKKALLAETANSVVAASEPPKAS